MADFKVKPQKVTKVPDVSENPWFWNPSMVSVRKAPEWFLGPLKRTMGEELEVTWNPVNERWQVWTPAPRIQHSVCRGWRLLFIHNGPSGEHLPLDERVYARLWSCSADQHGDGKKYFQRIQDEYYRDEMKKNARLSQEAVDQAMPFWDHSQIKVSMFGKSSGSKFSTYHA